ncbi:MAG: DUF1499 domain-containing protein [Pseudomonadota bacterium]
MEKFLIILVSILLLALIALFFLGYMSRSGEAPGLTSGQLQPCPNKPNCVNSEFPSDKEHFIEPLDYSNEDVTAVMTQLKKNVEEMGGNIQIQERDYLAATFTSSIFRFIDDFEIRIDTQKKQIHFRSASRVGHGDRGVNRKRVTQLKNAFQS